MSETAASPTFVGHAAFALAGLREVLPRRHPSPRTAFRSRSRRATASRADRRPVRQHEAIIALYGRVTATVARLGLPVKMPHDDLVCTPSVSTCDHPARRLALCALHAQLSRRGRPAGERGLDGTVKLTEPRARGDEFWSRWASGDGACVEIWRQTAKARSREARRAAAVANFG